MVINPKYDNVVHGRETHSQDGEEWLVHYVFIQPVHRKFRHNFGLIEVSSLYIKLIPGKHQRKDVLAAG